MLNVGTERQLFVDSHLIEQSDGVLRVLQEPVRRAPAIESDPTWDLSPCSAGFIRDDEGFKAWYRTHNDPSVIGNSDRIKAGSYDPSGYPDAITAYAESSDGIDWDKPNLGLFEINGSTDNSAVWLGPGAHMVPFKDPNPDVPDDERYKAIVRTYDLLALGSPDGMNWHLLLREPISTDGPFDSVNVSFWDYSLGKYVVYARGIGNPDNSTYYDRLSDSFKPIENNLKSEIEKGHEFGGGVRWIRRASSKDFRNWSDFEDIDTGEVPDEHFYTNACVQYERAPSIYMMFPSRFVVDRKPDSKWSRSNGVNDIVFMTSRDGLHFDRSFKEAFIRPGLDRNNWHDRGIYMETGILQTSPTEISLYGMENSHLTSQHIRRYTLRLDGFVSVNSGYGGGEFTTRPFIFVGDGLELNYSTAALGSVKVEIQDDRGDPIPGFAIDDCEEMFGDLIDGAVSWKNGEDTRKLEGKPVKLRFYLVDADLYAFKFNKSYV